eukprot:g1576.t1
MQGCSKKCEFVDPDRCDLNAPDLWNKDVKRTDLVEDATAVSQIVKHVLTGPDIEIRPWMEHKYEVLNVKNGHRLGMLVHPENDDTSRKGGHGVVTAYDFHIYDKHLAKTLADNTRVKDQHDKVCNLKRGQWTCAQLFAVKTERHATDPRVDEASFVTKMQTKDVGSMKPGMIRARAVVKKKEAKGSRWGLKSAVRALEPVFPNVIVMENFRNGHNMNTLFDILDPFYGSDPLKQFLTAYLHKFQELESRMAGLSAHSIPHVAIVSLLLADQVSASMANYLAIDPEASYMDLHLSQVIYKFYEDEKVADIRLIDFGAALPLLDLNKDGTWTNSEEYVLSHPCPQIYTAMTTRDDLMGGGDDGYLKCMSYQVGIFLVSFLARSLNLLQLYKEIPESVMRDVGLLPQSSLPQGAPPQRASSALSGVLPRVHKWLKHLWPQGDENDSDADDDEKTVFKVDHCAKCLDESKSKSKLRWEWFASKKYPKHEIFQESADCLESCKRILRASLMMLNVPDARGDLIILESGIDSILALLDVDMALPSGSSGADKSDHYVPIFHEIRGHDGKSTFHTDPLIRAVALKECEKPERKY